MSDRSATTKSTAFRRLAVIGAGNMGSGIAQKMATEGFDVVMVDVDDERVARGLGIIRETLEQGVERRIFRPQQVAQILDRVHGTSNWEDLADVDLVVEAVFEDEKVKREVLGRLDRICSPSAILATNTSSLSVTELAAATHQPGRVMGLHYFFHPAKNRLVEVVPGRQTDPALIQRAWALQEQLGKTPIRSADASGFIVNRFFVPWLNGAVRLAEEKVADIPTIEASCKKAFGVGMGPFELMNVTGVPIALHAATTLGRSFGAFYHPSALLRRQVESGKSWDLEGDEDPSKLEAVAERMRRIVFYVAAQLVEENVGTMEDTDIGARVGLRWPRGPFELMNRYGVARAAAQVEKLCERWELPMPRLLAEQAASGKSFSFRLVRTEIRDGVATLTVNRPDALNALNEAVVAQLADAFREAAADRSVHGIVIAGSGKGFIAGADIRFFVRRIENDDLDRIVNFTRAGHDLLNAIDECPKPVVARMHGLALGGGLELALACDRIVASTRASLAFPETGIGIYPGLGGTQRTVRRIGPGLTRWLVFTGQVVSAEEAVAIGLVDRVVPPEELDAAVLRAIDEGRVAERTPCRVPDSHAALAELFRSADPDALRRHEVDTGDDTRLDRAVSKVAHKAPVALRIAAKLIDEGSRVTLTEGLRMELDHLVEIFSTKDAYEGLSTLGKKRPEFTGA